MITGAGTLVSNVVFTVTAMLSWTEVGATVKVVVTSWSERNAVTGVVWPALTSTVPL